MRWKPIHTHLLLVIMASFLACLASGWSWLIRVSSWIPQLFLRHNWLLLLIALLCLAYVLKQILKKADELSPFLFGLGGLFLLIGGLIGPLAVILGFCIELFALYHHQRAILHAPDVPDIAKIR